MGIFLSLQRTHAYRKKLGTAKNIKKKEVVTEYNLYPSAAALRQNVNVQSSDINIAVMLLYKLFFVAVLFGCCIWF